MTEEIKYDTDTHYGNAMDNSYRSVLRDSMNLDNKASNAVSTAQASQAVSIAERVRKFK